MHSVSYKVALGGIISSLCLICMFLTGVFPVLYITLPMIAGVLMMIMSAEITPSWAYLTFMATGLLAMFVTFDKEAALLYILLFGHYPVTKQFIDKIKPFVIRLAVKLIIFNTCIISEFYLTAKVLGMTEFYDEICTKGKPYVTFLLILINFVCLTYDYSLNGILALYMKRIKPVLLSNR